ncbi:hypothetical protein PybrP1_008263 [[Pythium] brassicae (nom. inval.)]|nr:hypothetical protein PybrP1_008263 [[Pythium] brassicae (nom. inval.)]
MRSVRALATASGAVVLLLQVPTPARAQTTAKAGADSSSSTIVYVVVGVAALIVLLGGAFFWKRHQQKSKGLNGGSRAEELENGRGRRRPDELNVHEIAARAGSGGNQNAAAYDIHRSPAEVGGNSDNNGRAPRPPPAVGRPQPAVGRVPPQQRQDLSSGTQPTADTGGYSQDGSSTGGSAREDSARSREVLALVLADLQGDPMVGRRKIPYNALYFTRVLSKGAFGEVWLAQLENRQVAVKRILNEKRNDEKEIAMKIVQKVIRENIRPTFTDSIPKVVMDLARRCLNSNPDVRPDAMELLRIIQHIQNQL